ARGPLHLEGDAAHLIHVEVSRRGPRVDQLAAGLANRAQRDELAVGCRRAELLPKLATRDVDRLLAGLDLAFRNRPRPLVLAHPEWAAGMDEEHLELVATQAIGEQARRLL